MTDQNRNMEVKREISILEKPIADLPDVQEYFRVLSWHADSSDTQDQILACFLVFLLQVLDDQAPSFSNDRGEGLHTLLQKKLPFLPSLANDSREGLYALLRKNLSYLHAFIGDTPFQFSREFHEHRRNSLVNVAQCIPLPFDPLHCTFPEHTRYIQRLWIEFETLANEAWGFIYSCISASTENMKKNNFDSGIHDLLEKVETFFKEKIKVHCIKVLPKTSTSSHNHLSSLFIVGSLLEDLQCLMDGQFELSSNDIKDQLYTLIKELTFFLAFLKNIERLQTIHTNDELNESLIHFIDATFEAEYLICAYTGGHIPSWYLNLRIPFVVQKIQIISTRVQNIKIHSLKERKIRFLRYPEQDASIVVGYENIREPILADLVGGSKALQYISVVGMSGIGKSTMAKKLYNDRAVRDYFYIHVWCTVSEMCDNKKVLDEIWISLPREPRKDEMLNYESLAHRIYQTLIGRRYLIIFDDVWDSRMWDDLCRYFPDNGNGSRILLTSQIKDNAPAGSIFHQIPILSNSQCCELLLKKVFINESFPSEFSDIGLRIASKCRGLPLTVVVVAGILSNVGRDRDESAWRDVERNMDTYKYDDSSMQILELSYKYLPNHLKPCFLSLGWSFSSKDIPVRDIIPLWISHGYIQKEESKSKELIAVEYLLELIDRSLLIVKTRGADGGIKSCEFHKLIYDMNCRRSGTEELKCRDIHLKCSFLYTRHPHLNLSVEPGNICSSSALHGRSVSNLTASSGNIVEQMPLLRVMWNNESPIDDKMIGGLVHLRYFSNFAHIAQLPEAISKLVNLEYLLIDTLCKVDAPSTILKLVKLRKIRIYPQVIFLKNCDISEIRNNVLSLSCVRIRNHEDAEIFKCSPHLLKLKCICEGLFPNLISLSLLESLNIRFFNSPRLEGELTKMNFPSTLKKVTLSGTNLPWKETSVVGRLPNLQVLKLLYDAFIGNEWETRDEEFQQLKFLKIYNALSLRRWTSDKEHFPKLQHLVLEHVRVEIPLEFSEIGTLDTIEVRNCSDEVYTSTDLIKEEQVGYGNEDLNIITRGFEKKVKAAPSTTSQDKNAKTSTALEKSTNVDESTARLPQPQGSTTPSGKICSGCNNGHGVLTSAMGSYWHEECFCCYICQQPIYDQTFSYHPDGRRYHESCCKELIHPKCHVCKDFVRINADGKHDYQIHEFWDLRHCRSHCTDGTPECSSCNRFESLDATYISLDDGPTLCLECKESIIMNTEECVPLYAEILDFLEGLNIKMKQEFPVVLVGRQEMDEVTKGVYCDSYPVYNEAENGDESVVIKSILVLNGLPRMVTGYHIAYHMMIAWMLLEGSDIQNLSLEVVGGMCHTSSHMWLEHEISSSSYMGKLSEFEIKLGEYWKCLIENDPRSEYRDGFKEGQNAVDKFGLEHTLNHIRHCGTFPS